MFPRNSPVSSSHERAVSVVGRRSIRRILSNMGTVVELSLSACVGSMTVRPGCDSNWVRFPSTTKTTTTKEFTVERLCVHAVFG